MKLEISIGVLAWNSVKTLEKSLETYRKNSLLEMVNDVTVFFQETSEADRALARKFGVQHIESEKNIGIGPAFIALAEHAKTENILILEHDWNLIENRETTRERLKSGLQLLDEGFDMVKYRHRKTPGHPLFSAVHKGNELNYYDDWHECKAPHLLESVHWLDPAQEFPDKIQKNGEYFTTTARWGNWSNNPALFRTQFYLSVVKPVSGEGVQLERKMAKWWPKQNFRVAHGEGLFTHNDFVKYPPETAARKTKKIIKKILGRG